MRVQGIGSKLKTGVLGVTLLCSSTTVAKAAKTLNSEANLISRNISEASNSASELMEKSALHWNDIEAQYSAPVSSQKVRLLDILDPTKKLPKGASLIEETETSKIYKIAIDSIGAVFKDLEGAVGVSSLKIAVPKNSIVNDFRDCPVMMEMNHTIDERNKSFSYKAYFFKNDSCSIVDSINTKVRSSFDGKLYPSSTTHYYKEYINPNDGSTSNIGIFEQHVDFGYTETSAYGKMSGSGYSDADSLSYSSFNRAKDDFLEPYEELLKHTPWDWGTPSTWKIFPKAE